MYVSQSYQQQNRHEYVDPTTGYNVLVVSGAPLLGAMETIEATLSGFTFGLPISEVTF